VPAEATVEPPWLKRQVEAQLRAETVARLKRTHIYTSEEIVRIVGERYRRLRPRRQGKAGRIEYEHRRLETVFNIVYSRLSRAVEMPPPEKMSEFHRALIDAFVGLEEYRVALARVKRSLRLIREFWNQYRWLILTAQSPEEAARLRKEGSGRILSVVRRLRRQLELLKTVREELLRTHVVAEGLPIVVVAGIPSSGKSTLVSKLSTARPEVAAYPFTTKEVIVGKVVANDVAFYMVDTPGVLERPPEHQNVIERKALAALSTLPDIVVFLIDPSPEKVQDLDSQARLLRYILDSIVSRRDVGLIVAVNKVDEVGDSEAEKALRYILEASGLRLKESDSCRAALLLSALKGQGLGELVETIARCLRRKMPWLFVSAGDKHPEYVGGTASRSHHLQRTP